MNHLETLSHRLVIYDDVLLLGVNSYEVLVGQHQHVCGTQIFKIIKSLILSPHSGVVVTH